MCQILMQNFNNDYQFLEYLDKSAYYIQEALDQKGGEGYSALIRKRSCDEYKTREFIFKTQSFKKLMIELKNYITTSKVRDWAFNIVWFSRQKPEMEESFSFDLLPPH